jgi:hypothetical protein
VLGLSERPCDTFREHSLPHSIYTDCQSALWTDREPTLAKQLINKKPTTEVGRGLETLGVTLILAPYRKHGKKEGFRYGPIAMLTTQPNRPT